MDKYGYGLENLIEYYDAKIVEVSVRDFKYGLRRIKFKSQNEPKLIKQLDKSGNGTRVNIDILRNQLKKVKDKKKKTGDEALKRLRNAKVSVKAALDLIYGYIQRMGITVSELHQTLDQNDDRVVTKQEFVQKMGDYRIDGLNSSELGNVFDAMDFAGDGKVSLDEFSMFMEAVKLFRAEKIKKMDGSSRDLIKDNIHEIF